MKLALVLAVACAAVGVASHAPAQVFTFGTGADGNLTHNSGSLDLMPGTGTLVSGAAASDTVLSVSNVGAFPLGCEVVVLARSGSLAGNFDFARVTGLGVGTITIDPPLANNYSSAVSDVIRVYNFEDFTLGAAGTVTASGGALFLRVNGTATIDGSLDVSASGYAGGGVGPGGDGFQGFSYDGGSVQGVSTANFGGGGAGSGGGALGCSGGGGGEYGGGAAAGQDSNLEPRGDAGNTYGFADLSKLFAGSGGGSGATNLGAGNAQTRGGDGGGILYLAARNLSIGATGEIVSAGDSGENGNPSTLTAAGGGGGGAGGSIWLITTDATTFTNAGAVLAPGGFGGTIVGSGPVASGQGGDGGVGRIRLDNTPTEGSTVTPAPHLGTTTIVEQNLSSAGGWHLYE